jgi:cysteine sulfinate desulfinase/cysteine desulfurase-like protein
MKKKILSLALVAGVFIASSASAANYGMAGCGLGALIFPNDNSKLQIVSSILNGYGGQTFAITSGTSNCTDSGSSASAMYIAVNQESLKKDIARGEGESLNGLSQILNCSNPVALNATLQQNYATIFPSTEVKSVDVNKNIQGVIHSSKDLNGTCTAGL